MKSVFNVASSATRLGAYESPDAQVVLLHPEGVLCSSVGVGHEGFYGDDDESII
jgi:hypothetical protein